MAILSSVTSFAQDNQDEYFTAALDSSLRASQGGNDEVIDTLASSARASSDPRQLYINLLDYYLGAGAGEDIANFIIQEGEKTLLLLINKKGTP